MVCPSGETSRDIQVPSVTVNERVSVAASGSPSSFASPSSASWAAHPDENGTSTAHNSRGNIRNRTRITSHRGTTRRFYGRGRRDHPAVPR